MAHKKAGGSSRNGRDSESKRLGVKSYGGQLQGERSLGTQVRQHHTGWLTTDQVTPMNHRKPRP